jgi:hypothetical protein
MPVDTTGDDRRDDMVAAVFEAEMTREQAGEIARMMAEERSSRPADVINATLQFEDGRGRLIAVWKDRKCLDDYLAVEPVPRGTALMRRVGLEPEFRAVDVLAYG